MNFTTQYVTSNLNSMLLRRAISLVITFPGLTYRRATIMNLANAQYFPDEIFIG